MNFLNRVINSLDSLRGVAKLKDIFNAYNDSLPYTKFLI